MSPFDTLENERRPIPFRVEAGPEEGTDLLVLLGSTTNIPLHAGATLSAIYCGSDGRPFRSEDQLPPALHLYGTARWVAEEIGGKKRRSVLSATNGIYAQADGKGGRIVNWNNEAEEPREATRTGGMDVRMKFPAQADEAVVRVRVEVDAPGKGTVVSRWLQFPKAS